jgi:hypothetical protein
MTNLPDDPGQYPGRPPPRASASPKPPPVMAVFRTQNLVYAVNGTGPEDIAWAAWHFVKDDTQEGDS